MDHIEWVAAGFLYVLGGLLLVLGATLPSLLLRVGLAWMAVTLVVLAPTLAPFVVRCWEDTPHP